VFLIVKRSHYQVVLIAELYCIVNLPRLYLFSIYSQAVEDFHKQVSSVAGLVLDEFR